MNAYNINMSAKELDKAPINELADDGEVLQKIDRSILNWYDYFEDNLENGYEDAIFALGEQWTGYEASEYVLRQKVMLTVNVLYSFILNIVGEQRQNSPQIQIRALSNKTTQELLNIYEGLLRHIAYTSKSDIAYQIGFMNALLQGYGAWRVNIDYDGHDSFDKALFIEPIYNTANVYFDPTATEVTKADGNYCGVYTKMSEEAFFKEYGIEYPESLAPPMMQSRYFNWKDKYGVTIVEHFHRSWEKTKIYKLSNGDSVKAKDLDKRMKELKDIRELYQGRLHTAYMMAMRRGMNISPPPDLKDIKILDERTTELPTIKHYKLIKDQILEQVDHPGEHLPIIFLDGDSNWVNGRQETKSFVKHGKDSQKFINMIMSDLAHSSKVGHKGNFVATEAMIGDYKELWRNPEKSSVALLYKADPKAPTGKPEYIPPADLPPSLVNQVQNLFNMIQITLGRFEANRGAQGNEQSGVAINNRVKQGNTSVFIYLDNLNTAVEQTGRVCLDLIPEVYKDQSMLPIRTKDNKPEFIDLSSEANKDALKKQKLDVSVTAGPSFEAQKQDAFAQLMGIISALNLPPQIIADLVIANTNLENTPQLLDRVKNFVVSPQIIAKEEGKQPPPTPPDPQLQIAQTEAQARLMEAQAKIAKVQQDGQVANVKAQAEIGKARLDYHGKVLDHLNSAEKNQLKLENQHLAAANKAHTGMMDSLLSDYSQQ